MIKDIKCLEAKKYLRDHIFVSVGYTLGSPKSYKKLEGIERIRTFQSHERGLARLLTEVTSFPWNKPLASSASEVRRNRPELFLQFPPSYRGYHRFNYGKSTIWLLVGVESRWQNLKNYVVLTSPLYGLSKLAIILKSKLL